jgi:rhodanese-related sulfurtransferase
MDGEITPADLEAALADGESPLVVDIRQPGPFRREHIPESLNLPLPELVGGVEDVAEADHVVTVCPHGQASVKAARLIAAYEGFDGRVESLAGGLTAWEGPVSTASDGTADDATEPPF